MVVLCATISTCNDRQTKKRVVMNTSLEDEAITKRKERNMFIFLTVFLAPILSVIIVGALGFTIWISQILTGPPTS